MNEINSLFNKLKRSSLFKAIAAYAIFAFVIVQVASLVSDTFSLNQQFMKNLIWVFIIGFPFLAIIAWAASSKFSTFKILGIFLLVLATGYGSGSYVWVNNFVLPDLKEELEKELNYLERKSQHKDKKNVLCSSIQLPGKSYRITEHTEIRNITSNENKSSDNDSNKTREPNDTTYSCFTDGTNIDRDNYNIASDNRHAITGFTDENTTRIIKIRKKYATPKVIKMDANITTKKSKEIGEIVRVPIHWKIR